MPESFRKQAAAEGCGQVRECQERGAARGVARTRTEEVCEGCCGETAGQLEDEAEIARDERDCDRKERIRLRSG